RASELYSFPQILLGDRATVGAWPAQLKVTKDANGQRSLSTRAVVLDHGFLPGAEEEFIALLRAACARLAASGHTELMFLTSEGSPSRALITDMASHIDPYS